MCVTAIFPPGLRRLSPSMYVDGDVVPDDELYGEVSRGREADGESMRMYDDDQEEYDYMAELREVAEEFKNPRKRNAELGGTVYLQ